MPEAIVAFIRRAGLPVGILTRNSRASVIAALENFPHLSVRTDFDVMITREDPAAIKPSGEGVFAGRPQRWVWIRPTC
jgi:phosphoglycolate phosphatase-like HAD superfamily hydrolase